MLGRYFIKGDSELGGRLCYVNRTDLTHSEVEWSFNIYPTTLSFKSKRRAKKVLNSLKSNEFNVRLVYRYWLFGWKEKDVEL